MHNFKYRKPPKKKKHHAWLIHKKISEFHKFINLYIKKNPISNQILILITLQNIELIYLYSTNQIRTI